MLCLLLVVCAIQVAHSQPKVPEQVRGPDTEVASGLSSYMGTYRGLMQSDAPPICWGEVEFKISPERIIIRIANGSRVETLSRPWGEFFRMSAEDVAKQFRPGSKYPPRVTGFRSRLGRWPMTMLFLRDPDTSRREFALTLRRNDFAHETMLFGPQQVIEGSFDIMVSVAENQYGKDKLPRLRYDGRTKPQPSSAVSLSDVEEAVAALQRKDCARALALSRLPAEAGDARAQIVLATLSYTGCGVPANLTEALQWYNKAAEQGNLEAQLTLAELWHSAATRSTKNTTDADMRRSTAMQYYEMAADQGVVEAQYHLAALNVEAKKSAVAAVWFQIAAEQGFPPAQQRIAVMLWKGDGVPKDLVRAYMWSWLAAKHLKGSDKDVKELNRLMSPAQIAEAKKLAAAFRPRKNGLIRKAPPTWTETEKR